MKTKGFIFGSILLISQIGFAANLTDMAIRNICRTGDDSAKQESACRYVSLQKDLQQAQKDCGLVFKNDKACKQQKIIQAEIGKLILELQPEQTARAPADDEDDSSDSCENCG